MRLATLLLCAAVAAASPALTVTVDKSTGAYALAVDGTPWLQSPSTPTQVCLAGKYVTLELAGTEAASGSDAFGDWTGVAVSWSVPGSTQTVVHTFQSYASNPSNIVLTSSFPTGLDTSNCGSNSKQSTQFPAFDTLAAQAPELTYVTWAGTTAKAAFAKGLADLNQNGLDVGPVISVDASGRSVMWSSLTSHKIIGQSTIGGSGGPITSLWSQERLDQIACLSSACTSDQKADGNYVVQRVEGYALTASSASQVPSTSLFFRYSQTEDDNWVGSNSTGPDPSYNFLGSNGQVFTSPSLPNSLPLQVYSKAYAPNHTDWAAVASPEGIQWASDNGYTLRYTAGYVVANASDLPQASLYCMGVSAAVPSFPAGWSYSALITASEGGIAAGVYAWGASIQKYHSTTRSPAVTLEKIGYYTDDGAYFYVWSHWIPLRPWPAQEGLLLVKQSLIEAGVPIAYMQLDDWWYQGPFYFGNVKSIVNWTASNSSELFPDGLVRFSDALALSLQLYTPFWADAYQTPYNMTPSTVFGGTKLVTPADSRPFFNNLFDLGLAQTNGRMSTYEIDFLDNNFAGSASMFETVYSADQWYVGMAEAALERGITIQYCLPSPTDILEALTLPAVVQARASGDYVNKQTNAFDLGGSSLFMGAISIAPSKDTLWTSSPQPPTSSDTEHSGYTTQPHVQLDVVLAVLSLGPVGISDNINYTDVGLISQGFRSPTDGTLLRPSRPLSWVDLHFLNATSGLPGNDVRSTHALVPSASGPGYLSHYVVAWATGTDTTLGATDLYPAPAPGSLLAVRPHVLSPAGPAQQAGCVDGAVAVPSCVNLTHTVTIPATGTNLAQLSLTAVYPPVCGGSYFLGELTKLVHASPQRFLSVDCGGGLPAGLTVTLTGSPGQAVVLTAVDPSGTVRVTTATVSSSGTAKVAM